MAVVGEADFVAFGVAARVEKPRVVRPRRFCEPFIVFGGISLWILAGFRRDEQIQIATRSGEVDGRPLVRRFEWNGEPVQMELDDTPSRKVVLNRGAQHRQTLWVVFESKSDDVSCDD